MQRRLAQLLRDGEARAAGRVPAPLQARVIASALPAIHTEVSEGRVRADLYRRLDRAGDGRCRRCASRSGDFAALVPAIAAASAAGSIAPSPTFTQSALNVLAALPWRRNMQELEALLERILRAAPDGGIKQEDVLAQFSFDGAFAQARAGGAACAKRDCVSNATTSPPCSSTTSGA